MSGVMEMASELLSKIGKPAYVEFSTVAKEIITRDEHGEVVKDYYRARDVDMVTVRQIGSSDSSIFEVTRWLAQNKAEVHGGRLPREHADYYERAYQSWKNGQELPLEGTPIRGWAPIPPSQQETIVRAGVRTVEDLATMNAEACQRIGMGSVMLKNKAMAWVAQAKDKGPATMEIASLKQKNDLLEASVAKLTEQMQALLVAKPRRSEQAAHTDVDSEPPQRGIGLSDILDEAPTRSHHKKGA